MNWSRSSGILLHPTSLPGPFGIGDLGPSAYAFADFLAAAGQSLWQVLPLGPTGYGDSPYACYSAFAGNTLLISPEQLFTEGLIAEEDLARTPKFTEHRSEFPDERVNYEAVHQHKNSILRRAFASFSRKADANSSPSLNLELHHAFAEFCRRQGLWLDDYALFRALKDMHGGLAWNEWEPALRRKEAAALDTAKRELSEQIKAQKFYQFLFFRQWLALKAYCNQRGIKLVGDIPMFVAHDSADIWRCPEQFKLHDDGTPTVVAGVPPDYFSATGQLWGNPLYDWERMQSDGFKWWVARVRATFEMFDIARIDHFRGFAACWEIPAHDKTAEHGRWVESPGWKLFTAVRDALGEVPIIAEDLGVITPAVEALRDEFGFPGMRILQFAFASDSSNIHLPHNHHENLVVYTGTHDNDTAVGWFTGGSTKASTRDSEQIEREKESCLKYLKTEGDETNWDFIRAALASVANTAIVPLQDVLGLGTEARMNLPNSTAGNWTWRVKPNALTGEIAARLRELSELCGRAGNQASEENTLANSRSPVP